VAYSTGLRGINHSRLRGGDLWKVTDSSAALQSKLDKHIANLSLQKTSPTDFSSSLPKPQRFASEDIKNIELSSDGLLIIDTAFDNHDFEVGDIREGLLRKALVSGGFLLDEVE
jgi:hypothetical protein